MKIPVKLTSHLSHCLPRYWHQDPVITATLTVANCNCLANCYLLAPDAMTDLQDQLIITVLLNKQITVQQLINSNDYQTLLAEATGGMADSYSLDTSQRWHYNQQLDIVINHYHDNGKWQQHNHMLTTCQQNRYGINGSLMQAFVKRADSNYCLTDVQLVSVLPLMAIMQQMHQRNYADCVTCAKYLQCQQQLCYVDIPLLANGNNLRYLSAATAPMIQIAPVITNDAERIAVYDHSATPIATQLAIGVIKPYVANCPQHYRKTVMNRLLAEVTNNSMLRQQLQQL